MAGWKGKILLLNMLKLKSEPPVALKLVGDIDEESFQPHGLYAFENTKTGSWPYPVLIFPNRNTDRKLNPILDK